MRYSPTVADAKELIKFSADAYGDGGPIPPGWSAIATRYDPGSGFKAVAYQSVADPSRIVIAIAGTQFTNGGAIDTDGAVFGNNFPTNFDESLRAFLADVTSDFSKATTQIAVTGHSLGGFGTQLAVPFLIDQGFANTYGVTFGALGAGAVASEAHFNSPLSSYSDSILNLVNAGDPIGTLKSQIGMVARIGDQGPIWRFLDLITDILFPLAPLYLAGAIEAFHGLNHYRSILDSIPNATTLPLLQFDPTLDTVENSALLDSAVLSLRDATGRLMDPTVDIDVANFGQAYILLPGELGEPASLLTVPVEGAAEGVLVGLDRDGQPSLSAPAGAVTSIHGLEDGGARLSLNSGFGFDFESVEVKSDGSGLLRRLDGPLAGFDRGSIVWLGGRDGAQLVGTEKSDITVGGGGDDVLLGLGADDQLYGGGGKDRMDGGPGSDKLNGGAGDDQMKGGPGNDTMDGGPGNDTMQGGPGNDAYLFDGRGNDLVSDVDLAPINGEVDRIVVDPSVAPDQVEVFYSGNDLILRVNGGGIADAEGGSLRVRDGLAGQEGDTSSSIERIEFANGTTWTLPTVAARARALPPGDPLGESGPPPPVSFVTLGDCSRPHRWALRSSQSDCFTDHP